MLHKIISGGQTGADQGAIFAAFKSGVKTGGTAPDGYYTDFGNNLALEIFGLVAQGDYKSRTIKNVKDSDGTVLLTCTPQSPGSILTRNEAIRQRKPFCELDTSRAIKLFSENDVLGYTRELSHLSAEVSLFVAEKQICVLNVAGNREKDRRIFSTTKVVEAVIFETIKILKASDLVLTDNF